MPRAGPTLEPIDADRFALAISVDGEITRLAVTVDEHGRLTDLAFPRYGNQTPDKHFQYIPFGGAFDPAAERIFGGYTIPTQIRAGWWYATPQYEETFRLDLTSAAYE